MPTVINHFYENDTGRDVSFKVKRMLFSRGGDIEFRKNEIVIVTGPNNSGKSQLLREISQRNSGRLGLFEKRISIAKIIEFDFHGTCDFLCENAKKSTLTKGNEGWFLQLQQQRLSLQGLIAQVEPQPQFLEAILRGMLTYLSTNSRLLELRTSPMNVLGSVYGTGIQPPVIRRLHEFKQIEEKISSFTKDLFGMTFAINRFSFHDSRPHLLNGDIPTTLNRNNDEIARWFEVQPTLDQQGDGVTAFCGMLSTILADPHPLIVLDEPELFLHPPQIRQLARIIATETSQDTQIFVATHSEEFVRGMIEFGSDRVSVMRITRSPRKYIDNKIRIIDSVKIEELWRDPLLKTSDALSSLFYNTAVIVEGDSDARFLRSMVDALADREAPTTDIRFFHCGGKDRIYRIASAFRAIGIVTVAVVDIDILDDRSKFKQLVEAFDGDFEIFSHDLNSITNHVMEKKSLENAGLARVRINEILDKLDSKRPLSAKAINGCLEILKSSNPWVPLKTAGVEALDAGEPSIAIDRIISNARSLGILINPYGELESLWKHTSESKSQWVSAALQRNLKSDPKMKKAREFARDITDTISTLLSEQD